LYTVALVLFNLTNQPLLARNSAAFAAHSPKRVCQSSHKNHCLTLNDWKDSLDPPLPQTMILKTSAFPQTLKPAFFYIIVDCILPALRTWPLPPFPTYLNTNEACSLVQTKAAKLLATYVTLSPGVNQSNPQLQFNFIADEQSTCSDTVQYVPWKPSRNFSAIRQKAGNANQKQLGRSSVLSSVLV
jgi:hypothetical protein